MKRLRRYLSTIIAALLSLFLVWGLALPLDYIAKTLVGLAVFALVYFAESRLFPRKPEGQDSEPQ